MKRVLVVDDYEIGRYALRALFESAGYEVAEADHGADALVKARHAPPDLAVSDVLMPVMDGYTLCRIWKEDPLLKQVPFVFYTGTYTDPDDRRLATNLGADAFILRPAANDEFLARVTEVLARAEAGQLEPPRAPIEDEHRVTREYNAALIRKLEDKLQQLEDTNQALAADMLKRKAAEDDRRRLQAELLQSQKLESIGLLAGGIAHDFNNLLTAIQGFTALAHSELPAGSEAGADLEEVQVAASRAADITRQLLAFARKQPAEPKVIDVTAAITRTLGILRRLIGENIEVVVLPGPGDGNVRIDPGQFEQVMMNLAVNARDAMPAGGKLTVETENVTVAESDSAVPPGPCVQITVTDSGTGMDSATLARIFEPFFTTKSVGMGTGLGLATCHGIITQAGGSISAFSTIGKGTSFRIVLPRVREAAEEVGAASDASPAGAGETILLVEDEPQLRRLATRALAESGYEVLAASNGVEALRLAKEHRGPIHLLLTDLMMPYMGGEELAERLKQARPETKVLLTSGYAGPPTGNAAGGLPMLAKPYTIHDLARKVNEVLQAKPTNPESAH